MIFDALPDAQLIQLMPADRRRVRHELERLTDREIKALELVARGLPDEEIADALAVEANAVRKALTAAMRKTGARNRAHLVAMAYALGLMYTLDSDRIADAVESVQRLRTALCEIARLCGQTDAWATVLPLPQLVEHILAAVRAAVPPRPAAAAVLHGPEADKAARLFEVIADALAMVGAPPRVRSAVLGSVLDSTGIPPAIVGPYRDDPAVLDALAARGVDLDSAETGGADDDRN